MSNATLSRRPTRRFWGWGNDDAVLSAQEKLVLTLASKGYNYDEVAARLEVSRHTVATYVKRCYKKLQVNSKSEAIYEARKHGLVKD